MGNVTRVITENKLALGLHGCAKIDIATPLTFQAQMMCE